MKFSQYFQFRSVKMSTPNRKKNLLDFKQKRAIIDYAMKQIVDYFSIFRELPVCDILFLGNYLSVISYQIKNLQVCLMSKCTCK